MVLINNDSHEEEQKRQQCETGKCFASCAFDDLNFKFKRPKVYAIRNFPEGFEQLGSQTTSLIYRKLLGSVRTSGNLLGKKDSTDNAEDYCFEPFEIDVACQQMSAHSEMDHNLEPMVENIVASEEVVELDDPKFNDPLRILGQESIGLINSMKSISRLEVENVLKDEARTQEMNELSSLKMRPELYFPRKRGVSAIPPGCGTCAKNFRKEDYLKALVSSKNNSSGRLKEHLMIFFFKLEHLMIDMEDTDRKLSGESADMNQSQVECSIGSDHIVERVVVQALMARQRCPRRQ